VEALKDNSQMLLLSVNETHSKEGHSCLSWMIPTSITSVFGIPITSAGKETNEAEPEIETENLEADSHNDSGGYSDDDAGFDGLDPSEDDSEGGADDDGE